MNITDEIRIRNGYPSEMELRTEVELRRRARERADELSDPILAPHSLPAWWKRHPWLLGSPWRSWRPGGMMKP